MAHARPCFPLLRPNHRQPASQRQCKARRQDIGLTVASVQDSVPAAADGATISRTAQCRDLRANSQRSKACCACCACCACRQRITRRGGGGTRTGSRLRGHGHRLRASSRDDTLNNGTAPPHRRSACPPAPSQPVAQLAPHHRRSSAQCSTLTGCACTLIYSSILIPAQPSIDNPQSSVNT